MAFSPRVPEPVPVDAVTVYVVPLPLAEPEKAGDVRPPLTRVKLALATPVTDSLNVTVQLTVAALVGLEAFATIEVTVGADLSIV